ncbi:MAG: acyl-CoA dehydrogenase family protein [Gammaproteobacteria bacterium]|nr:acyl-CoA dehydrogenase family protein [Gammaproteobacteria bacterium]
MSEPTQLLEPAGFTEILANARAITPYLAARSAEIEEARRLPSDVVDTLKRAGAFRIAMPRIWGGPELTSMEQVEVIEQLSMGDASVGWCVMIGCDSGLYSGFVEDGAARKLWPELDMVQAGWVYPMGRADLVNDGYRVSGQWMFCSGSSHADNIAAGCIVFENGEPVVKNGRSEWRIMVAPKTDWEIQDVWHTTGLRGTASNDYTTGGESLFVPRENSFYFTEPKRDGALWARPDALLRKMAGIPLGVARRVLDEVIAIMHHKVERRSQQPYRDMESVRSAVGEAHMTLGAARSYLFATLENQWRKIERDEPLSAAERADLWFSRLNAFQSARKIVRSLYDIVGGNAIYTGKHTLDRALRDVETMCQHIVGQRRELSTVGGLLLNPEDEMANASPMLSR